MRLAKSVDYCQLSTNNIDIETSSVILFHHTDLTVTFHHHMMND